MFIPYAQRAKKMDMKKLKAAIWSILVNAEKHQVRNVIQLKERNLSYLSHISFHCDVIFCSMIFVDI